MQTTSKAKKLKLFVWKNIKHVLNSTDVRSVKVFYLKLSDILLAQSHFKKRPGFGRLLVRSVVCVQ